MKGRWAVAPAQPLLVKPLAEALKVSPLLAQCLINRGLADHGKAERFLRPRLKNLADPFYLPDMVVAVDRLVRARERRESVVIFGDYDVDGVTSTTLLAEVLRVLGWQVSSYLPHRLDEGYGLSLDAVENCLKKHPATLLLAVDCGSTAAGTIQALKERSIDVIVLDHHQVSQPPPPALALVNPHLAPPGAPSFRELCSAGLSFKMAHALIKRGRDLGWPAAEQIDIREYLDLVALGTIADLVPMTGENRIFVITGLERLNTTKRPGLRALKAVSQVSEPMGSYEVGFQLAPRLNAAGRLETAEESLRLLLAEDYAAAEVIARSLDARNRERQQIERGILEQVSNAVHARFNPQTDYVIVEGQILWHIGVVGIVASRMAQEFYRPTIILGGDGHEWRGSGRSIEGFDLAAALRGCSDLLLRHGGHAMAAGLSMDPAKVDAFRVRLNELAHQALKPDQLKPVIRIDAEVILPHLTKTRVEELDQIKPSGPENPPVQFMVCNVTYQRPPQRLGREGQHAKFWITDEEYVVEVVWWNCPAAALPEGGTFDLAFVPQINEFEGQRYLQLRALDWRPSNTTPPGS